MTLLLYLPVALSALLLGAHFLRAGSLLLVVLPLCVVALLALHRTWTRRLAQVVLVLGAFEWLRTLLGIAQLRAALGQPWLRMALILGAVALFTALSALLLEHRRVRARHAG